jgi:hypothetical protein
MSNDFDINYESSSPCCGESLGWDWDESELQFGGECSCGKNYYLIPNTAIVIADTDNEDDNEFD